MISLRRSLRPAPGSGFLAGLLLVLLGLSGVLAYQALDAARSEARATEQALRGYAGIAARTLVAEAEEVLARRLAASLVRARAEAPNAAPGALAPAVRRACGCDAALLGAFRVGGGDAGRVETAGSAALARWLADEWGASRGAEAARTVAEGGDTVRVRTASIGGRTALVVYVGRAGEEAAGFAVDAARSAGAAFDEVFRGTPLLSVSTRGAVSNRHALGVLVSTRSGEVVFRAPAAGRGAGNATWVDAKIGAYRSDALVPGQVSQPLAGLFDGLTAWVAVRSRSAAGLAPAEEPSGRLPLLLTVFGLTLALVCVAIVQLRRQQELARLRDDFVSGVSHELRTPLAQVRLFAELLDSERLVTAEQRRRSVRIINEEARRLTYLVENILHFSRAQRGAARVAPDPVELGPLIREIVDAFAPLARARDASFALEVDDGVVARVDPDALRQVLLNLLDNAVKYGPVGQRVRVSMALAGFSARIQVDDRGPGVPVDERWQVWEPYRRLERDARSAAGGSGIGLAVVRDLVVLHGGRVGVEEAPGGGARFWVELPDAMYAGPSHAAAEAAEERLAAGRA
jgi:signal transduction histidine kinase